MNEYPIVINKKKKYQRSLSSRIKRNEKRRKFAFPRVLKRDIRRKYAIMYANTANSHDQTIFANFLETFFSPDFETKKYSLVGGMEPNSIPLFQLQGRSSFLYYIFKSNSPFPDHVLAVKNFLIIPDSQNITSKIIMQITIYGTKCCLTMKCPSCHTNHSHGPQGCPDRIFDWLQNQTPQMGKIAIDVCHVFYLNETNYVNKVEIFPMGFRSIISETKV